MTIEATAELVNAILSGDKDQFNSAFETAIASKVSDALEVKKIEVASNWLGTAEVADEEPAVETEVQPEVATEE